MPKAYSLLITVYSYKGKYPNAKSVLNNLEKGEKLAKMNIAKTPKNRFSSCIEKILEVNLANIHRHETHPIDRSVLPHVDHSFANVVE